MNIEKQTKAKPGAIYHFSCKVHGRSDGSNAVKLAAYRAGARLKAENDGSNSQLQPKKGSVVVRDTGSGDRASLGKRPPSAVERG